MPETIALALAFIVSNASAALGASVAVQATLAGLAVSSFGVGAIGIGLAIGASALASSLLSPTKPALPTPEDGKYNLRQNVPSRVRVYGKVKKAGDYIALEEKDGIAYHIIAHASHKINSYVSHFLHDNQITTDGSGGITGYIAEEGNTKTDQYILNGNAKVNILTRLGNAANTAYSEVVSAFPTIWTTSHRGDGIASILMRVTSVDANNYTKIFPQGMPTHSAIIEGVDDLYDPRDETTKYSSNLALIRMDHLMHESGLRLSLDDLHLPDWIAAANVCDENVTNRSEETESRYHGGFWYRYENDIVEVGRTIDEAADMVLYETASGKVGVHAGTWVEPDFTIEARDIISVSYDANRRAVNDVIAVRGKYTDPTNGYNSVDAAPYGEIYPSDDDERTKTVNNVAVQSHNHMQRLQKLRFIRSRAARVKITAAYTAAKNVPFRRFVKVNYPPKLDSAYVEVIGRPTISLQRMTVTFDGIVVPSTLYAFDAAIDEGVPNGAIEGIASAGIPDVADFAVVIQAEAVSGTVTAAYALATFTSASDALIYELEYVPAAGGATVSQSNVNNEEEIKTAYLADGVEYKFRMRARSAIGRHGDWTSYITLTATADATAPGVPTNVDVTGGTGEATVTWTNPNSANFASSRVYRNTANDFGTSTLVTSIFAAPSAEQTYVDTSLAADDYYYWVTSANGSSVESAEVAAASNPATVS